MNYQQPLHTLYNLFDLLYGKNHVLDEEKSFHRDPDVRKNLIWDHFGSLSGKDCLDLSSDTCDDAVIRALLCMSSGRSRGGVVSRRKRTTATLSQEGSTAWDEFINQNLVLLKAQLPTQKHDEFKYRIRQYLNVIYTSRSDKNVFREDILKSVVDIVFDLTSSTSIERIAKGVSILLMTALLQDKSKDAANVIFGVETLRSGFYNKLLNLSPNVYLTTKKETESERFPFYEKMYGVRRLLLVNFAGTTFVSGADIDDMYLISEPYKRWFAEKLTEGKLVAECCINNPYSDAARDAAVNKMKPVGGGRIPIDEIISHNISVLLDFKRRHPDSRINLYVTNKFLPYGIMVAETEDISKQFIKIDLYDDSIPNDTFRHSMYLTSELETRALHDSFAQIAENIKASAIPVNGTFPFDWIRNRNRPLIHRARISEGIHEHSIRGIFECIKRHLPVELDLLYLPDGNVILGRDATICERATGITSRLGSYTLDQIRKMRTGDYSLLGSANGRIPFRFEETLELDEALGLISGRVPILLEVKCLQGEDEDSLYNKAAILSRKLKYYNNGLDVAVHSASPYFLRIFRDMMPLLPLGIISFNYSGLEKEVDEHWLDLHRNFKFTSSNPDEDFIDPDFISYRIDDPEALNKALDFARSSTPPIPCICWTVRSAAEEFLPEVRQCDNITIEGAVTFTEKFIDKNNPEASCELSSATIHKAVGIALSMQKIRDKLIELKKRSEEPLGKNHNRLMAILDDFYKVTDELLVAAAETDNLTFKNISSFIDEKKENRNSIIETSTYPEMFSSAKGHLKKDIIDTITLINDLVGEPQYNQNTQ